MSTAVKGHNFRAAASDALTRAKLELNSGEQSRLRYAALELRFCIEALTYDRAQAFGSDYPPKHYDTWQPQRVLRELVELDPHAGRSSTLKIRKESLPGEPEHPTIVLGTQEVLGKRDLKEHQALSSYLHHPTLKQVMEGRTSIDGLRTKCIEVIAILERVLGSKIHNAIFASHVSFDCDHCGRSLKKRVPSDGKDGVAVCFDCDAQYDLIRGDANNSHIPRRKMVTFTCPATDCDATQQIPVEKLGDGVRLTCQGCKKPLEIGWSVFAVDVDAQDN